MKNIGILTFHCSDNYGAMLQAYAMKTFLINNGQNARIIRYEPLSLTGKHFLFPYIKQKTPIHTAYWSFRGFLKNLKKGSNFKIQHDNMNKFRKKYLIKDEKKISPAQINSLGLDILILGSDQIWNPDITYGLDDMYFGANFKGKKISYAASIGGSKLNRSYDTKMKKLISNLDSISVRESKVIDYIKQFTDKEVIEVLDPVFLINKKDWEQISAKPLESKYILLYETYEDKELERKAKETAAKHGLKVIRLNPIGETSDNNIIENYTSGPAEFLGYILNADFVFTNSFHATSLSIILNKKFFVKLPVNVGERVKNVLSNLNLISRMKEENIDIEPNWTSVNKRISELSEKSKLFLINNIL